MVTNGWVEADINIWGNNFVGKFRFDISMIPDDVLYMFVCQVFAWVCSDW